MEQGGQESSAGRDEGKADKGSGRCCQHTEWLAGLSSKGMPRCVSPLPSPQTLLELAVGGTCPGHRAAGGRASPCAWSQGLLLPLQAGTSLCSPERRAAPQPSLGAASQAVFIPPGTPAAPVSHREWGKGRALQNPHPKKGLEKPKCSSGTVQGLPVPSAACLPLLLWHKQPGPVWGGGFGPPLPMNAEPNHPKLSWGLWEQEREQIQPCWGVFLPRGQMWVTQSPAHPAGQASGAETRPGPPQGSDSGAGFGV